MYIVHLLSRAHIILVFIFILFRHAVVLPGGPVRIVDLTA